MVAVMLMARGCGGDGRGGDGGGKRRKGEEDREEEEQSQISVLAVLLAAIRRSVASSCRMEQRGGSDAVIGGATAALRQMEIGFPTDVRHVAHVTFDRFRGFLGLPVEFELEIPCRAPSARFWMNCVRINGLLMPGIRRLGAQASH